MTVFISGGSKNGKSAFAQRLALKLSGGENLYYIATMIPSDGEDRERIARHVAERWGLGFETVERGRDILGCLENMGPEATVLLDSVTALLSNEMFPPGAPPDSASPGRVAAELTKLLPSVKQAIFVSDYIYSDAYLYDGYTELFRRGLADIDRTLAARCDAVVEACAGCFTIHKGVLPL